MYEQFKQVWTELTGPGQAFEVVTRNVRGVPLRTYARAPNSLREVWQAVAGYAERDYLVYADERVSYQQAQQQVASIALWLQGQGVRPGDRVAIAMRNYPEWMLGYWAITSMGAVVVGMNAWWTAPEMEFALADAEPRVMLCDSERLDRFALLRARFPQLVVAVVRPAQPVPDWAIAWEQVIRTEPRLPDVSIDPDADACIFYTSGTTGRPKGACLTHRSCVSNILNMAFVNTLQPRALALAGLQAAPDPVNAGVIVALVATPLFHVTANNCVAQGTTLAGGKLVHMYKWDAAEAMRLIEREQITNLSAVPMMSREILLHPDFARHDLSSLKTMGGGGAALQPDLVKKIDAQMPSAQPNTGYGMTETSGIIAAVASKFYLDRPASVGPAVPTLEARCVDLHGNPVPAGEVGELWVRGAPVIRGYLNRPEATAEAITDGWLHTGDVAYMDQDGFIYLVDRAKDMVIRGGENVYCSEVENVLFEHTLVAECVVFSVPDERLGEEVGAAVLLQPGAALTAIELRAHCAAQLSSFKLPRYIWFVDQPLPRNASGKFLKREIREALSRGDANQAPATAASDPGGQG